jgi:thymidylate kinase
LRIIYLEGLPGLGKTTTAVSLAAGLDQVVFVAENNPTPARYTHVDHLDARARAHWYLHTERARQAYAVAVSRDAPERTVVCDKGALATLAHTYAICGIGMHPWSFYEQIRDDFLAEVPDPFPADASVIILTGSLAVSLRRRQRRRSAREPRRALWFDSAFLRAYQRFFEVEAVRITARPVKRIDAAVNSPELLTRVAATADLPKLTTAALQQSADGAASPLEHGTTLIRRFAAHIGDTILGNPIGSPFTQLGHAVQAFERHLIIREPNRRPYLQQDLWESPGMNEQGRNRVD